jgi:hypothetical protein
MHWPSFIWGASAMAVAVLAIEVACRVALWWLGRGK